jgi:hypothetical protein
LAVKERGSQEKQEQQRASERRAMASSGQQIALFRNLFRGRDDVYARRWQSADGSRSGYMPASVKDWNAINRSRPEDRKKVDQATRTLLPLTDAVIE